MNATWLETQLVAYLSLRETLGVQMRAEKILLPDFVAFVQAQGTLIRSVRNSPSSGPVRHPRHAARAGPRGASAWHEGFSSISAHLRQTLMSQSQACCHADGVPHPTCLRQPR
jgi:hypothetical protein